MGAGLISQPLTGGQGSQGRQVTAGGGAALMARGDSGSQGAGGQVVKDPPHGQGAALFEFWVAVSQQIAQGEAKPGQVGGHISGQPHGRTTGGGCCCLHPM